jgi:hypothetical protein
MDVNRNIIPIVEDDQGEGVHDPLEESEIAQTLRSLTRKEARDLAKKHKIPWKIVQQYRRPK